nr:uncharacterized protein LOC117276132 [Nicotiana tomentosiformis]
MDISTYNTKFFKLARYAPYLVPTEEARVQRFVYGLSTLLQRLKTRNVMSVRLVIYVRRPRHEDLSVVVLVKIEEQEIRDNNNRVIRQGLTCLHSPHTDHITDRLSSCYAIVNCHAKIVKVEIPNEPSFILRGSQVPEICKVVSFMKAQRILKKGCLGLFAIVNDTRKEQVSSISGHVVSKDGIMVDPKKTKALQKWHRPISPTDIRNF